MDELIRKQDALDALTTYIYNVYKVMEGKTLPVEDCRDAAESVIKELPTVQPDEKLERCLFEYINACRTVTCPTPDTTKKDISDAYAVIKVLQPIFGDVAF